MPDFKKMLLMPIDLVKKHKGYEKLKELPQRPPSLSKEKKIEVKQRIDINKTRPTKRKAPPPPSKRPPSLSNEKKMYADRRIDINKTRKLKKKAPKPNKSPLKFNYPDNWVKFT
jgi:hypothetical protein